MKNSFPTISRKEQQKSPTNYKLMNIISILTQLTDIKRVVKKREGDSERGRL